MAAVISTRVWIFGPGDYAALTAAQKLQLRTAVRIASIYWKSPTNIADTFSILDNSGNIIQDGVCEVALQSQYFNKNNWFQGVTAVNVSTGTLEINIY